MNGKKNMETKKIKFELNVRTVPVVVRENADNHLASVHVTHCCSVHGCKYGDDNCPVELGLANQAYECEECGYDNESNSFELKIEDLIEIPGFKKWFEEKKKRI